MEQMFQLFQKLHKNPNNPEAGTPQTVRVAEKLNFNNYTKWCKLMHIAIGGRGRLNHITANPVPPVDPEYQQWAQKDSMVLSWIIENIDGDLVNQFLDYKTAIELWKGIETLLSSGRDELQIYDLNTKAATLKQGATDTMTHDPLDIVSSKNTHRTQIQAVNGQYVPIAQAETDAQAGRIIRHGTERGGLYYVDEATQHSNALLAHGSPEHNLWMWHRRLGHPFIAIATSTYLTNRLPTKPLNYDTPLDTLGSHVSIPSSHSLPPRVFGCIVYVHLQKRVRTKLEPRAVKCVFIGYGVNQKGYRCYDPIQDRVYTTLDLMDPNPTTQVGNTTDVTTEASLSPPLSTPVPSNEHPSNDLLSIEVDSKTDTINEPNPTPSNIIPNSNENLSSTAIAFTASLYSTDIPKTVEDALGNEKWRQAMEDEYLALQKNKT
uniref:Retroviral polymerase SH3-like domain-containing protein n=1 Tax=Chenopodium quinoa TaxID=63459 RepID=A0A803M0T0_CHEQI